jgi:hypothetical protein
MTGALLVQMFVDVFPLFDISYVLSALSMYGLILSDQIEQDLRRHGRSPISAPASWCCKCGRTLSTTP